jgi:uncharacterized protein YjiS (DUF1127 family)
MPGYAHPSLTSSHLSPSPAQARQQPHKGLVLRLMGTFRLWRRRARERDALARLTDRELADFGASRSDVHRELATPFWRAQPPC